MSSPFMFVNPGDIKRYPEQEGALEGIKPYEFWRQFSRIEIVYFAVRHGMYCIPTLELVDWLKRHIGGRTAIEIGSGNGLLAKALDIPATDNRMQDWPEIRALYDKAQQPVVKYGSNVETLDALDAIKRYAPQVVLGAWVTHRYDLLRHEDGGNTYGPNELEIIKQAEYVFIGACDTHRHKPILQLPHEEYEFPWLVSRSFTATNFIGVWRP